MNPTAPYIDSFPVDVGARLNTMRSIILDIAPEAEEGIAYNMPSYKLNGKPLVYFAGFAHHIGFYALPVSHSAFAAELASYKKGKGSVQFPHNRDLPLDLVRRMVEFRVVDVLSKHPFKGRKG